MPAAIPLLLATLLPAPILPGDAPPEGAPPDVLFLAVDDLADWVGCLDGHPDAHTPNIDRLAERGVLFTNAYCVSPICGPSRASVLTGRRPETTGVYTNKGTYADYVPDAVSLPRRMKGHGYRVLGAGKVNHGLGLRIPEDWDEYGPGSGVVGTPFTDEELRSEGMLPAREVRREGWSCTLPMNGGLSMIDRPTNQWDTFDWGPLDAPEEEFPDAQVAAWGVQQLARHHDRPFFLAVGIYKPHQPFFVPRSYFERFDPESVHLPPTLPGDLDDVPPAGRDLALRPWTSGTHRTVTEHGKWREAVAAYLATVSYADARVGEVVDALGRSPRAESTWIVLWSDHGWSLGEKDHWGKHDPWSSSLHVPLIVVPPAEHSPEGFAPGSICDAPVSLLDLYPTVLDACDLPVPEELEGRSLLPLIADPRAPWPEAVVSTVGRGTHSISTRKWRYIRYFDGSEELYDLESDPEEWVNRAGDPDLAEVMAELASFAPRDERVLRYVRRGRWKCVLRTDGTANLFDLHAPMGISEQDDLAAERPEVVEEIRAELERLEVQDRHVNLDAPADERRPLRIVAFGDSTTAPRKTVQEVYADRLPALLAEKGIEAVTLNRGRGGSHTGRLVDHARHRVPHALDRLETRVRAERPDLVVVQFGINDSWVDQSGPEAASRIPLADYRQNLETIVSTLRGDGAVVLVMTPNPLGERHETWRRERLAAYARAAREVAESLEVPLVDIHTVMEQLAAEGDRRVDDWLLDGSHPGDAGHALVARELCRAIVTLERTGRLPRRTPLGEERGRSTGDERGRRKPPR